MNDESNNEYREHEVYDTSSMSVEQFRESYYPLSNTYPLEHWIATEQGIFVPTAEHAYMANRFASTVVHQQIAHARADVHDTRPYAAAMQAKALAHAYIDQGEPTLYTEAAERVAMMQRVVRAKLLANRAIYDLLLSTGDQLIEEGNDWGDQFWGVDRVTKQGHNQLGKIYMALRKELSRREK